MNKKTFIICIVIGSFIGIIVPLVMDNFQIGYKYEEIPTDYVKPPKEPELEILEEINEKLEILEEIKITESE